MEHLLGVPHWGRLLFFPTNIRLGMKRVGGTNALAYFSWASWAKKKV